MTIDDITLLTKPILNITLPNGRVIPYVMLEYDKQLDILTLYSLFEGRRIITRGADFLKGKDYYIDYPADLSPDDERDNLVYDDTEHEHEHEHRAPTAKNTYTYDIIPFEYKRK